MRVKLLPAKVLAAVDAAVDVGGSQRRAAAIVANVCAHVVCVCCVCFHTAYCKLT